MIDQPLRSPAVRLPGFAFWRLGKPGCRTLAWERSDFDQVDRGRAGFMIRECCGGVLAIAFFVDMACTARRLFHFEGCTPRRVFPGSSTSGRSRYSACRRADDGLKVAEQPPAAKNLYQIFC